MGAVHKDCSPQPVEGHVAAKVDVADATGEPNDKQKRTPGPGSAGVKPADAKPAAPDGREYYMGKSASEIEEGLAALNLGMDKVSEKKLAYGIKDYIIGKFGKDGIRNYDKAKEATDELLTAFFQKYPSLESRNASDPQDPRNVIVKAVNQYLQGCLIYAMINAKTQDQLDDAKKKVVMYVINTTGPNNMSAKDRLNGLIGIMNEKPDDKSPPFVAPKITADVQVMCEKAIAQQANNHP